MRLTWRDGVATLLTAAVAGLYWAYLAGADLPLVSGPRALAGAVLVIGLGACAIGGGGLTADGMRSRYGRSMSAFAAVPGIAALVTIITGNGVILAVLVTSVVAMWLVATLRHAFVEPGGIADEELHRLIERERDEQRHR
jgi:Na+-transporting methylmalonyl-CoA/oxaloacetate decarboxylase gamma subunit